MKSKAMVVKAPGQMVLETFELAKTPADHVLVKTAVTSVCATDIKVLKGLIPVGKYPVVMGHEIAGEVVEIGSEAKGWYNIEPGDKITIEPYIACGKCEHSRSKHYYHYCTHGGIYGISLPCDQPPYLYGGYSEYFYIKPGSLVHKQNPKMADSAASISSVVANGVRWVKTLGQVVFGESVVISGPGSQGLCSLAAALHSGANPVVVLGKENDTERLKLAKAFGAHHVINVDKTDAVESVLKIIPEGPDVVIETSGTPEGIQAAIQMVKQVGRIVNIGLSGGVETPVKFDDLVWKSVSIINGLGQAGNVADAMKLIDTGKYPFEKINNFTYTLAELETAIRDTEERPEGFIKGAIVF